MPTKSVTLISLITLEKKLCDFIDGTQLQKPVKTIRIVNKRVSLVNFFVQYIEVKTRITCVYEFIDFEYPF